MSPERFPLSGLSPWIRGTQKQGCSVGTAHRFIPVDTGNTITPDPIQTIEPVYPRGYGEHYITTDRTQKSLGLSPWIRGTLYPVFSV